MPTSYPILFLQERLSQSLILIVLGLGEDGHTASLFPGKGQAEEIEQPVIAVSGDYRGRPAGRVTFTPTLINEARHICFLVQGAGKAAAVENAIEGIYDPLQQPAQRIKPHDGEVIWILDQTAASRLTFCRKRNNSTLLR